VRPSIKLFAAMIAIGLAVFVLAGLVLAPTPRQHSSSLPSSSPSDLTHTRRTRSQGRKLRVSSVGDRERSHSELVIAARC
jgi:hypothetical protein